MSESNIDVKAPGKLLIAGEYSVLHPGYPAVVVAVDRYIHVKIAPSNENRLSIPHMGLENVSWTIINDHIQWSVGTRKLAFIEEVLLLFQTFLQEHEKKPQPVSFMITSELDDPSGKKYGLGSSAAVVVAVVTALLHFYQNEKIQPSQEAIYKLSAIAHYKTQGNGSCADIAAATFGGWLHYSTFDADWLLNELQGGRAIKELLQQRWPGLFIHSLTPPPLLQFCVGWTGNEAATAPMVNNVEKLYEKRPDVYERFLTESRQAVLQLVESFQNDDTCCAIMSLKQNREALRSLGIAANVEIETAKLKKLIAIADQYGSGKSSGAGGGDCGIAFVETPMLAAELMKEWRKAAILPLPIQVTSLGATVKKY